MSTIQEKLDSLQPYVLSIRYVQGIQVVDAVFKDGWTVPKSEYIEIEKGDTEQEYYMFFSEKKDIGIDELLDYIENIININIEREMKYELLKEKVKELKTLFNTTPLEKLKSLKFKLSNNSISEDISEEDILLNDPQVNEPHINNPEDKEKTPETITEETKEKTSKNTTEKSDGKKGNKSSTNKKQQTHGNVELPPKNEKIVVEEYEPLQTNCNCDPNDVCPICASEKGF